MLTQQTLDMLEALSDEDLADLQHDLERELDDGAESLSAADLLSAILTEQDRRFGASLGECP